MVKRKVRVYGKINLYETSIVGIPAYPDAHASADSFSLIKSLSKSFVSEGEEISENQIDIKRRETKMEEAKAVTDVEVKSSEPTVEKKVEVEKTTTETIDKNAVMDLVKDAVQKAVEEFKTERGLISQEKSSQETQRDKIKSMSIGELAIASGLFVPK